MYDMINSKMDEEIKRAISHLPEGEISTFIKDWLAIYTSLIYCFITSKFTPPGFSRLLLFTPIFLLFLYLPLNLHSVHLCGNTAFFITWLANFKLLLLAFGHGPLSDISLSAPRFLVIACLPIRVQKKNSDFAEKPLRRSNRKNNNESLIHEKVSNHNGHIQEKPSDEVSQNRQKSAISYAIKAILMGLIIKIYDYSDKINPTILLFIYTFHIYFSIEIVLAILAALARTVFGFELEPQFNEPYLSTSLQDFWGKRWNLTVSRILRPTVYEPALKFWVRVFGPMGRKWTTIASIMSTFIVSGLMHELIYFYLSRAQPTWEITCFFLLHGACLVVEISIKKAMKDTCRFPRLLGTILTVGFVTLTSFWLFFPQLLRCEADAKAFAEYAAVGAFVKDVGRALKLGAMSTFIQ